MARDGGLQLRQAYGLQGGGGRQRDCGCLFFMFTGEPRLLAEVAQASLRVAGVDRAVGHWGLGVHRGRDAWIREGRAPAAASQLWGGLWLSVKR